MKNGKQEYTKSKKGLLLAFYIIGGIFAIGAIQFTFDSDHTNDMIGSYFTLGIVADGMIIQMLKELWAGRMKAAMMELLFTFVFGAAIVWALMG
ncbi:hypothetical protein [Guptibacillus algicola]|uniref:hypothetical protein n=1 Tax=Guptibacillus algicola TaxID=225844 RepID=UPI001CD4E1E3|nr:hypothetical protein [Alkalihalobacillus algicola]MCA0985676.1 hypothetical protein [Alkalihalobacillus algicola]